MEISKVFIVGGGLMGCGIAQACAQSGIQVIINDVEQKALNRGMENIAWSVGKLIEKGKLSEDKNSILGRIQTATDFSGAKEVDRSFAVSIGHHG